VLVLTAERRDGLPFALGAILLWSTSAAVLVSLPGWTTPQLLLGTHAVAAVALNAWAVARLGPRRALASLARLDRRALALGLLGTFVYQMAYVTGLKTAPAAEANLLNYLWPLCTALLAIPIRAEHPGAGLWAALGCGLLGLAVLVGGPAGGDYPLRAVGYSAALAAALAWGLYSNLLAGLALDPLTSQRAFVLLGAAGFGLTALVEGTPLGPTDSGSLLRIAYVGCAPVALAVLLWQAAMQRGPVQRVAAASYLTPVLSTLWLALLSGAAITPRVVIGLALVLAAAMLPSAGRLLGVARAGKSAANGASTSSGRRV
jgi:drug/metabolite transporter (DMT)-like permease